MWYRGSIDETDSQHQIFSISINVKLEILSLPLVGLKKSVFPFQVSGENVPKPINSFEECNFSGLLLDNIKKSGYSKPTPVQKYAISAISSGRDVMACAQTGSGKTVSRLIYKNISELGYTFIYLLLL